MSNTWGNDILTDDISNIYNYYNYKGHFYPCSSCRKKFAISSPLQAISLSK